MRIKRNINVILTTGKPTFLLDLSESLELSDEKLKLTMTNMLRNLIEKTDSMKENVLCKQKVWNTKKETKGNARNKNNNIIIEFFS